MSSEMGLYTWWNIFPQTGEHFIFFSQQHFRQTPQLIKSPLLSEMQ